MVKTIVRMSSSQNSRLVKIPSPGPVGTLESRTSGPTGTKKKRRKISYQESVGLTLSPYESTPNPVVNSPVFVNWNHGKYTTNDVCTSDVFDTCVPTKMYIKFPTEPFGVLGPSLDRIPTPTTTLRSDLFMGYLDTLTLMVSLGVWFRLWVTSVPQSRRCLSRGLPL